MSIRTSFGGKHFRVSLGTSGIGWSVGTKGFRVSHRAGTHRASKGNSNIAWWLFIGWWWYLVKYMCLGMWYMLKYMFIGMWHFCKFFFYTLPYKAIKTIKNTYENNSHIKE